MSNKKLKENKFRAKCFEAYGLNSYRNFLTSPECECGCGGNTSLLIKDSKELFSLMNELLVENECDCCAIFAHGYDDAMYAAIKLDEVEEDVEYDDEDYPIIFLHIDDTDITFFKEIDAEFTLHCYGLLIQNANSYWDIIEE